MRKTHQIILAAVMSVGSVAAGQTTQPAVAPATQPFPAALPFTAAGIPADAAMGRQTVYIPSSPGWSPQALYAAQLETPADVDQRASCLLQIDGGLESSRDTSSISLLLNTTAFCDPVIAKVLKLPAGSTGRAVLVATVPTGRFVRVEVSLKKADKPYEPGAAAALLKGLVERLRAAMEQSLQAENKAITSRTQAANEALESAKTKLAEVSEGLRAVREALGQSSDFYGNDPSLTLQNLRTQNKQAESELTRLKNRLAAMEPDKSDAVTAWQAAVEGQEARLVSLQDQFKLGKATQAQIAEQQTKLAESKTQLATAKAQAAGATDQSRYSQQQARELRLQVAEQESRVKQQQEQLAKLTSPEMARKLAGFRDQQQEEQRLRNDVSQLSQQGLMSQRTSRDRGSVTITVLDGGQKE